MRGFKESNEKGEFKIRGNNLALLYKEAINLQNKGNFNQAAKIYHKLIKNKYFEEKVFLNYASICQHQKKSKDYVI